MIKFFTFDKYKTQFQIFAAQVTEYLSTAGDVSDLKLVSNESGELIIQIESEEELKAEAQDVFLFDNLPMRDVQQIVDSVTKETNADDKLVKSVALTSYRSGRGVYLAILTVKPRNDLNSITSTEEQTILEAKGKQEGDQNSRPDAKANATGKVRGGPKNKRTNGGGSPGHN